MHDLHVADKVNKMVLEEAVKNNLKIVKKIVVELGSVVEHGANISKENLIFNLNLLNKGTIAENAEVVINEVAGNDWRLTSIAGN